LPSLRQGRDEGLQLLSSLGALYVHGFPLDWATATGTSARRRIALPTYPFQRQRCWLDQPGAAPLAADGWLGRRLATALPEIIFEAQLSATSSLIGDHRIDGTAIVAGASYAAAALIAAQEALGDRPYDLEGLAFAQALVVPDGSSRRVQLVLTPQDVGSTE